MERHIEINCDMGEGYGRWKMGPDEALMQHIDVANIACGFHAGDPSIMMKTVRLAKQHSVRVGAHPGLPDLAGFGRRRIDIDPEDMFCSILYQVGALVAVLLSEGMKLNHVKPHGELYFYIQRDPAILRAVVSAVRLFEVPIYGLPTRLMTETCRELGVELIPEFFPDIDYDGDGNLVSVTKSTAVDGKLIDRRIRNFALRGEVLTSENSTRSLGFHKRPFSICLHSDLPGALDNVIAAKTAVAEAVAALKN
ncbi:hypothetical protein EKO04_005161 [Ascochyta lentis]|uniref:Lactam utilization protein n=1 Tax=Ascochyta lentis TaxID=205686 RepID=A0A8H7J3P9_9PLEO|nr:hypothetical protein EKO04_005161 [Ascochyta lentis]